MRGARWLLLLAIVAILGWLGFTYRTQRSEVEKQAPTRPDLLPVDVAGTARDWHVVKTDEKGAKSYEVWARNFKQDKDSSRIDLEGVRLHLFHQKRDVFDSVESPFATFQPNEDNLYSDGKVFITLAVPTEGKPTHRLVSISTSGVTFNKTGKASTDRAADFIFENGTGKCVGAVYDPSTRELQMNSSVVLNLNARGPNGKPMKLESGQLIYKEAGSQILLSPWTRLTRGTSVTEGADTIVTLKDDAIQLVETQKAKGVDMDPKRHLEYSADHLIVHYAETGDVDKVAGEQNARLVSSTEYARTTTTTDRIDLEFDSKNHESTLKSAFAHGHALVESKPIAAPAGAQLPDTRVLRSEAIEMKMRPGGREIETVTTHAPGHLEFLPNHPGSRRRQMDGEQLFITYGERNLVRNFRSVNVETRSDPAKPTAAPSQTWSKNLEADFDPKTGQMAQMRQWDDFRYVEGTRKAVARKATLDQTSNRITLESAARVWDPTGSTAADVIHLDQESGNFTAEGHVSSSRQEKQKTKSDLLSGDEPVQATAQRMVSTNHNSLTRYEGNADMWQGGSRIRADRIEIDREAQRLVAAGGVETQLREKEKDKKDGAVKPLGTGNAPPVFTIVKSAGLVYTDTDRLAYYTGGALLTRPNLRVKSLELRSYLSEAGSDNSLERSYADGKVEVQQTSPARTRIGTSEHAEYYSSEDKIILRGGDPALVDNPKGNTTRGAELTYFAGDDRLFVNGAPEQPAKSHLRRKK
jgi:lipopolysaccharide export system protein LptA